MPIAIAVSGSFAPYSGIIRIATIPSTAPEMPQMIGSHLLSSADRKSTRLNSSHEWIREGGFGVKKKKKRKKKER